jgi:hypothetical protein
MTESVLTCDYRLKELFRLRMGSLASSIVSAIVKIAMGQPRNVSRIFPNVFFQTSGKAREVLKFVVPAFANTVQPSQSSPWHPGRKVIQANHKQLSSRQTARA